MELPAVSHRPELQRFEALVEGRIARADYRLDGDVMRMVHTEVPLQHEGRGIAAALVAAAFAHAQANGLKIAGHCSYVRAWMRRHPETKPLWA